MLCGSAIYLVRKMASQNGSEKTPSERAITTLVRRMIYYPIVQAVSRSGYAWYQEAYGTQMDPDKSDNVQFALLVFIGIITPTLSVGNLLIFLRMQPHAYTEFKLLFSNLLCLNTTTTTTTTYKNINKDNNFNEIDNDSITRSLLSENDTNNNNNNKCIYNNSSTAVHDESDMPYSILSAMRSSVTQLLFNWPNEFDQREDDELIDATAVADNNNNVIDDGNVGFEGEDNNNVSYSITSESFRSTTESRYRIAQDLIPYHDDSTDDASTSTAGFG